MQFYVRAEVQWTQLVSLAIAHATEVKAGSGGGSDSRLFQVVGKLDFHDFHVVTAHRSLFSCWLFDGGYS